MSNSRLDNVNKLYDKQVKDYQEFKNSESALNAKASVHMEQMEETLALIPRHILESLNLLPPASSDTITVEQMEEYSQRVESVLDSLTDKIEKYLETSNIEYLKGIESVVGIDPISSPLDVDSPLKSDSNIVTQSAETEQDSTGDSQQGVDLDPFSSWKFNGSSN